MPNSSVGYKPTVSFGKTYEFTQQAPTQLSHLHRRARGARRVERPESARARRSVSAHNFIQLRFGGRRAGYEREPGADGLGRALSAAKRPRPRDGAVQGTPRPV